jgi:hypothetical protein
MRTPLLIALLLPCAATAQEAPPPPDATPDAPATSDARTETLLLDDREPAPALGAEGEPLPEKILENPPPDAAPTVSIRTDGSGDIVEEYRQNGAIYMVKVRPTRGVPYMLLDTNGDGRLDTKDGDGPVRPVYWTVYEWN